MQYVTSANEKITKLSFKQFFTNNGNKVNNSTSKKANIICEQIPKIKISFLWIRKISDLFISCIILAVWMDLFLMYL